MGGGFGGASLVFVLVWYLFILIPCVGISWIGVRLIERLGRFPSKTPAIQMGIMFQLIVVEVVSLTLLVAFFKVLTAE